MTSELANLDATEQAELVRRKEVSPLELVDAAITRIEKVNPQLNAAVTPLGNSVKELYENQLAGRSGVDFITHFDASAFPTKFAAELKDFDLGRYVNDTSRWNSAGPNGTPRLKVGKM